MALEGKNDVNGHVEIFRAMYVTKSTNRENGSLISKFLYRPTGANVLELYKFWPQKKDFLIQMVVRSACLQPKTGDEIHLKNLEVLKYMITPVKK